MKSPRKCLRVWGGVAASCSLLLAQTADPPKTPGKAPASYDQSAVAGGHHRLRTIRHSVKDRSGKIREEEATHVELESGLYYWENGRWWRSKEQIEVREHHAVAYRGPHKVVFQPNLNRMVAVDLTAPDGQRFRSHVLGIAYYDTQSGQHVLLAEVKDSTARLVPPNQLVYPDAFTDFKADVRYTYTKAGLEQDVILQEAPPRPEEFGLNPATTVLEVLTEFLDAPVPRVLAKRVKEEKDPQRRSQMKEPDLLDEALEFQSVSIGLGRAFHTSLLEEKLPAPDPNNGKGARAGPPAIKEALPVCKRWVNVEGRQLLVEALEFPALKAHLEAVPAKERLPEAKAAKREVSWQRVLPKQRPEPSGPDEPIQLAGAPYRPKGLVIDYYLAGAIPNLTFKADTTYHINGEAYLTGTTTIEAGAVIKFGPGGALRILGGFKSPAQTAYLTSEADSSVGVPIPIQHGSESNPTHALGFYNLADGTVIKNLEIRYAIVGLQDYSPQSEHTVEQCRFFKCRTAVEVFGATVNLKDLQLDQVETPERNLGGAARINSRNLVRQNAKMPATRPVGLQYDHGDSPGSATSMGSNDSRGGYLDYDGDYDYFRVDLSSAGTLTAYTSGSTDTYGYLKDFSGSTLTSNDDNPYPNFSLSYSVGAGTYYIAVRHFSWYGRGSYTLYTSFSGSGGGGGGGGYDDHGNDIYTASNMGVSDVRSGTINYPGDEDYFWINVSSSGTLTAYTSSSIDTYGYLLNAGGSILTYDDDTGTDLNFYWSYSVSPGTHYVRVRHYSSSGTGSYTLYTSFSASTPPPSTPTGLGASPAYGEARIYLSWASVSGASGYNLKRWNGSYYNPIGSTSGAYATSYTDSGLSPGTTYSYVVSAYNAYGESGNSSSVSSTTAPTPPSNVSAFGGSGYVSLSWSVPAGVYGYNVKRSTTSGGPHTTVGTTFSASYSDYGVSPGATYYYVVSAFSVSGGESYNSYQVSGAPAAPVPSAPAWLTATPGIGQISLQWPSSTSAASYNVKRWNGSYYETLASTTATTYLHTSLGPNVTHSYVVSASNSAGTSGDSPSASATTAPAAPTGVGASGAAGQITLSWLPVSGAATYRVKRLLSSGGPVVATYSTSNTSFTETGLFVGTTYYYVVSAVNSSGTESTNSSQVSATASPTDNDFDGLPDSWETQYFGNLSQTGSGDPDVDGVSNSQEYQSNTNPLIANAMVKIARPRNGSSVP